MTDNTPVVSDPDRSRPDRPDTTSGYMITITHAESMQAMRQCVNSARCAVIRHHRATADDPVRHEPVLAEELWRIIETHRATARIFREDLDPGPAVSYTVVLDDDPDGSQEWFTTHEHPDPVVAAAHPALPMVDVLDQAKHILSRYPHLPTPTDVHCGRGGPRITLNAGPGYTPSSVTALVEWAKAFGVPVKITPGDASITVHIVAPGADGGVPVAFQVIAYVYGDKIGRIAAGMSAYPGVTFTGVGDTRTVMVPCDVFAGAWARAREENPGERWPDIPGPTGQDEGK